MTYEWHPDRYYRVDLRVIAMMKYCHHHLHHHHVVQPARISLTLSRHFSRSFIASGRSSGLHPVSSHSCSMYILAGRPAFARPYVWVHRSALLMSSSLLLQQFETASGICSSPKFSTLYSLITPTWPHTILVPHWSRHSPMRCLLFIGHGPHPRDVCLLLATAPIYTMLALYKPRLTSMQCVFPELFCWFYFRSKRSAGFIAGHHHHHVVPPARIFLTLSRHCLWQVFRATSRILT